MTNMITNYHKTIDEVKEYAQANWNVELDLTKDSFDRYMKGEAEVVSPQVSEVAETVITEALSKDLGIIEPELKLVGHQYHLPNGERIDVLAENSAGQYVVVELKKAASLDALDQLLGYMAELKKSEPGKRVRGIIMSSTFDQAFADKIRLLRGSDVDLRYFTLKVISQSEEEARQRAQ